MDYVRLVCTLLLDNPVGVSHSSIRRDIAYLQRRCASEGFYFLAYHLPAFAKALERGLETGQYEVPNGFKRSKRHPGLPAFMQDVLIVLFDSHGLLQSDLSWIDVLSEHAQQCALVETRIRRIGQAVSHVRQIGYACYKVELPSDPSKLAAKVEEWYAVEASLPEPDHDYEDPDHALKLISHEIEYLLSGIDLSDIRPRHGPGAVATGEVGDEKWAFRRLYLNLHPCYGHDYFTAITPRSLELFGPVTPDDLVVENARKSFLSALDCQYGGVTKMVAVPKNFLGDRLISTEPLELMWIQEGQQDALTEWLHRRSRGRINFKDQSVNGALALTSSLTREYATLDLKDASDRVAYALVKRVFPPEVFRYLDASRSPATITLKGELVVLRKFAPMGSAVCFPVESAIFWAMSVVALHRGNPRLQRWAREVVYTYGDDVIVPREYAQHVCELLERFDLKVNRNKSFINGFFRESCGVDAYAGIDVTPVRFKAAFPTGRPSSVSLLSWCTYAANLAARGYTGASEHIYTEVEALVGPLPFGTSDAGYLCRRVESATDALVKNYSSEDIRTRFQTDNRPDKPSYQRWEVRALRVVSPRARTNLDGWERLFRNLTVPQDDPDVASVRTEAQALRIRWCPIT